MKKPSGPPNGASFAPTAPASVFVYWWLLLAATATVFLAAGPSQGALGIFLAATGAVLVGIPARVKVSWWLWLAVAGLLATASLAFLPAGWFAPTHWREALATAPAIQLPSTVTPVPWQTGFWLGVLAISCVTGLYLLAQPIRSMSVLGVAAGAAVICGVYAGLSIYAKQSGWHYPYSGGASFGFFPNRNHTATFLVVGSIIALGVVTTGLRERRWLLSLVAAAALALCVTGLFFFSGSRGGVIFLGVGTVIWVVALGARHRNVPLLVSALALLLAAAALFVTSGGEARARLLGTMNPTAPTPTPAPPDNVTSEGSDPHLDRELSMDYRLRIYRDDLDLIKDAPATGVGLGAFAPTFAQYRRVSLPGGYSLHPESDWLMLTTEAGIPALICAIALGVLLLARLRGAREHPFWPLRWACAAAAITAVLHGVVDVPVHRVALGWWVLIPAALGFQSGRASAEKSSWMQRGFFVLTGLGALGLGTQLIRAEWFAAQPLPPFAAAQAEQEIRSLFEHGETFRAWERAESAINTSPLASRLYYQYGTLALQFQDTDELADRAFAAERALNPNYPNIPLAEGDIWASVDPKRAASLWTIALDRQARQIHATSDESASLAAFFKDLVARAKPWPAVQGELAADALRSPAFLLAWVQAAEAPVVKDKLLLLTQQNDLLARFTDSQREQFLIAWYAKGDQEQLSRFVKEHDEWQTAAWTIHLRDEVTHQQMEAAVRETAARYHVSLDLPAVAEPSSHNLTAEMLPKDPAACFVALWNDGNTIGARKTLADALSGSAGSTIPPESWRLAAALAVHDGAWPNAWGYLRQYLSSIHQGDGLLP